MFKGLGDCVDQQNNYFVLACRWLALSAVLFVLWTAPAVAGTKSYGQVTVTVEPPAQGESYYGYAVYRMTVINRGKTAREVTVILPASSWSEGDSIFGLPKVRVQKVALKKKKKVKAEEEEDKTEE